MTGADPGPDARARGWLAGGGRSTGVLGFVVCFVLAGAAAFLRNVPVLATPVEQPIAFNHAKHVQELTLECSVCHASFETEAFSGLPGLEVCASCHSEPQGSSKEEAKLVQLVRSGAPLEWRPLFRQPPHVFYSHRRHVVAAKIQCPTCHGSIAETTAPPASVERLRMQQCIDCHRSLGVSTVCTACHR
jgi:hypothetical protein